MVEPGNQHQGDAMTATTDTLTRPAESTGSPEAHPPSMGRRVALGWIAVVLAGVVVAALTFATFTGGGDIPAQGFYPEAEQYEREAHLEGNARTHSRVAATGGDPAAGADEEFLAGSRHVPTQ
jgi:hypothetical protein